MATDVEEKLRLVREAAARAPDDDLSQAWSVASPGRPDRPALVHPSRVPRRRLSTPAGRAALVHAIAHIEFNAINLALDAVCRFADLPMAWHADWGRVAAEEARHFEALRAHLRDMGHDYGDFEAHNGLWELAEGTGDSPLARMGLVPRIVEARGLDVTPGIRARFAAQGETAICDTLDLILREEIGHVAIGNHWFAWLCERDGLDPAITFEQLRVRPVVPAINPPFNRPARLAAGFSPTELDAWEASARKARATD
jgi:uncharacterized ferritin-like protein (DUF455 family)